MTKEWVINDRFLWKNERMFNEIVRKLPTNEVEIEVTSGFATYIRSGKSEFHLIGQDAIEYPLLPEVSAEEQFTIPADLLKSIIRETVFAVATSESRPVLTGVNWDIQDDELKKSLNGIPFVGLNYVLSENYSHFIYVLPGMLPCLPHKGYGLHCQ